MITYRKVVLMALLQIACAIGLVIFSWVDPRFDIQILLLLCILIFTVKIYLWWKKWIKLIFYKTEQALGKQTVENGNTVSMLVNLETNLEELKQHHDRPLIKERKKSPFYAGEHLIPLEKVS